MYKCVCVELWWTAIGNACPASSLLSFGTNIGNLPFPYSMRSPRESQPEQNDKMEKSWIWLTLLVILKRLSITFPALAWFSSFLRSGYSSCPSIWCTTSFPSKKLNIFFFGKVSQNLFCYIQPNNPNQYAVVPWMSWGMEMSMECGRGRESVQVQNKRRIKGTITMQCLLVGCTKFVLGELLWERKRLHLNPQCSYSVSGTGRQMTAPNFVLCGWFSLSTTRTHFLNFYGSHFSWGP